MRSNGSQIGRLHDHFTLKLQVRAVFRAPNGALIGRMGPSLTPR